MSKTSFIFKKIWVVFSFKEVANSDIYFNIP